MLQLRLTLSHTDSACFADDCESVHEQRSDRAYESRSMLSDIISEDVIAASPVVIFEAGSVMSAAILKSFSENFRHTTTIATAYLFMSCYILASKIG